MGEVIGKLRYTKPLELSDFDFGNPETLIEGAVYDKKQMVVVHDTGGMFGVDPCAACTHYMADGGMAGEVSDHTWSGGLCTPGDASAKFVANGGTYLWQLSKDGMQIGASDPVPALVN